MKRSLIFILFLLLLFIIVILAINYVPEQNNKSMVPDNNMESDSASSLEASFSDNEMRIHALLKEAASEDETAVEIFDLIKDIDWKSFYNFDEAASVELLDWIDKNEVISESSLTNLLMATKGLDGAIAEKYSATVANIMLKDKKMFFKCLSKLPAENIDKICALAAYGCSYYDLKQIKDDLNKMVVTEKLSDKEIMAIRKMINSLNEISSRYC